MADWLILNEGSGDEIVVPVVEDGARGKDIPIGGEYTRAFDGTLRATVSTSKKEWEFTSLPLDEAEATAIEVLLENGNQVTLSGPVVGANTFDIMGSVLSFDYIIHGLAHRRQLHLLLQQV